MTYLLTQFNPWLRVGVFGAVGIVVGHLLFRWMVRLTEPIDVALPTDQSQATANFCWWHRWPLLVELATGALFAGFAYAYLGLRCQQTLPEVNPSEFWWLARVFFHLVLIALLITATGTDFRDFTISDRITGPGILIGILCATIGGELQMMHVWIDWNDPMVELHGPYLPGWMDAHRHLHGFVWSVSGMLAGGGITWLVRKLSTLLLGQEAMGFGDVTLMAMIGSFVGWQPVLFVFLLAPLCGVVVSLAVRLFTGRTFLPYGPYLSAAAIVVLFTWRWIWTLEIPISADREFSIRKLMGDWQALIYLAGISCGALVMLLGLLRLYRAVPVGPRVDATHRVEPDAAKSDTVEPEPDTDVS